MKFRLPGLHSLHWKVFAFHVAVLTLPVGYLAWELRRSLEVTHLQATEEGMIDTAAMAGDIYARLAAETGDDSAQTSARLARYLADFESYRSAKARLFGFTPEEADTRLIFYDRDGAVLYDTLKPSEKGRADGQKLDVRLALAGRYGSRWQLDRLHSRVFIYSTLPVWQGGRLIGAVSVVKPTTRLVHFVVRTLKELLLPIVGTVIFAAALAYVLSAYLTRIVRSLALQAERIAAGESGVRLETWTRSELGALARAVERMRRKLEGKAYVEETVTNLSHELKTPLAAIRGAAELLEDGAAKDPVACARFLGNIQQEVVRLDGIVDGLLQLARLESAPFADPDAPPLDLTATLRALATETYVSRAAGLGVHFTWNAPDHPVRCRISGEHFMQIVGNLLDNALHFTLAGDAIHLDLSLEPPVGEIARLTVRDEGQGIEPEILPKIFNRFFTTQNPRTGARGTGLGLALVKSVVEAARGSVEVRSELGKGSEFVVRLPVVR
jgi:signal transduction histidine kinase